MEILDGIPWFTPPADIDPTRTPIRGGSPTLADLDLNFDEHDHDHEQDAA